MAETRSTFQLGQGASAPAFALPDADGKVVRLEDVMGAKGLLVVFACNHCPFVVHLATELGEFAKEIEAQGIGTVVINSNDLENYPQDGPEPMKAFASERGWHFPYLLDETQEVAKAYGAACTPDFFLFGGDGRLFYAGQFDETRPRQGKTPDGGDLREAARRMVAGDGPLPQPYPSSGCNIKWKPGNEPG
jgi:peroxiredoxin